MPLRPIRPPLVDSFTTSEDGAVAFHQRTRLPPDSFVEGGERRLGFGKPRIPMLFVEIAILPQTILKRFASLIELP
jgi:hypothetical protein